ncbi:hypothetical protein VPH35_137461 [Triticum aestivum]
MPAPPPPPQPPPLDGSVGPSRSRLKTERATGGKKGVGGGESTGEKASSRLTAACKADGSYENLPTSNGYLIVEANGGLNQQRLSICDAVAVASLLNATLVIPIFHLNSVWRDPSKFSDIFYEDRFIGTLRQHVRVVKELPKDVLLRFNHNISSIPNMQTKAYSSRDHYVQKVLPNGVRVWVVRIAPFSNRLAQSVPSNIQALRCLVNYETNMVVRMMKKSSLAGGKYVSVHLRFKEVGMMLRGMGFDNTTFLYVASGKIYNAAKYMGPLRQMFPLLQTKDTLALSEELAEFEGYSSRLAALDYTICVQSEVFVTTQGGNFPHFLMGHRCYLLGGNAKTIKPDKRKLVLSFDDPNIRWNRFNHHMLEILHHSDIRGITFRKPNDSIYTFPMPDCMCQQDGI